MEDTLSRPSRLLVLLTSGLLAFSCSNDAFGPEVTDSPAVPPKVLSVTPANRSIGPEDQSTVVIEFNKSMNESSLRKSVTLLDPAANAEIDTTECWLNDAEQRHWVLGGLHELDQQFPTYRVGQLYRLELSNKAADIYGNHLAPFWYEFTPEPYFRLKTVRVEERVNPSWSCWFNSPVDSSFYSYVRIDPPMDTRWIGEGTWNYHWVIEGRNVVHGQTYTLTIRDGAHDRFGNPIEGSRSFLLDTRVIPGTAATQ